MEKIFQPSTRQIAVLGILWPQSRYEIFCIVRRCRTKEAACQAIMIAANCHPKLAEDLYEIGVHMLNEVNINENLLN